MPRASCLLFQLTCFGVLSTQPAIAQCTTPQGNASLSVGGLPYPGSSLVFSVAATPYLPLVLAGDTSPGPFVLPFGGKVCLSPAFFLMSGGLNPFQIVPPTGVSSTTLAIPSALQLVGSTFHFQAAVFDNTAPNGKVALSNGSDLTIQSAPTYQVVFYDGFETDPPQGPWTASSSLWLRAPTSGAAPQPFAGAACATPSPGGTYPACGVDTTWESPILQLPAVGAGEALLLRYQVLFAIEDGADSLTPRIMTNPLAVGSSYQDLVGRSMTGASVVWCAAGNDLTAYAGQLVRLGFRFTTAGCCCSGTGVFMDELKIIKVSGVPQVGFAENFDAPGGLGIGWLVDNGLWEVGTPPTTVPAGHTLPPQPFSGSGVAGTLLGLDYPRCGADSRLITPPFVVPALQPGSFDQYVYFRHWMSTEVGVDYGQLQYSDDGGASWHNLGPSLSQNTNWTLVARSLRDSNGNLLTGQTIQLGFFFASAGCCCGGAGWFLDDVIVQ